MTKKELTEKEKMQFSNQMDPEMEEQRIGKIVKGTDEIPTKFEEDKKTITQWCMISKINLLDPTYFDDTNLYTAKEFEERVPRNIQIPLVTDLSGTALDDFAKGIIPEKFAKDYKKMKKLQDELTKTENEIKAKLIEMFESIPEREQNSVSMEGLRFTYVGPTQRKTVDSKKLQEEYPEIYKKCIKFSNVKSSIRTTVEY